MGTRRLVVKHAIVATLLAATVAILGQQVTDTHAAANLGEGLEIDSDRPPSDTREPSLEDFADYASNFERSLALDKLLESATPNDIRTLLAQSDEIEHVGHRIDAQIAIFGRFASIDPIQAIEAVRTAPGNAQHDLREAVFREWAHADLEALLEHATRLEDAERTALLELILRVRDDLPEERLVEIAAQIDLEAHARSILRTIHIENSLEFPERALVAVLEDRAGDARQVDELTQVALAWIERDGETIVQRVYELLPSRQLRGDVIPRLLRSIGDSYPLWAIEQALGFSDATVRDTARQTLFEWSFRDPKGAFNGVSELADIDQRKRLQVAAIQNWARRNPYGLFESLEDLPGEMRATAETSAMQSLSTLSPKRATEKFDDFTGDKNSAARSIVGNWSMHDFQGALDWILASPDVSNFQNDLLKIVFGNVTSSSASSAMDVALGQLLDEEEGGVEADIVAKIASENVQVATALLERVREGRTKLEAYVSVASVLLREGKKSRAVELAAQLSGSHKVEYVGVLAGQIAAIDQDEAFEFTTQLSSSDEQSRAALWLLTLNRHGNTLTKEQESSLTSMLNEEDVEQLESGLEPTGLPVD